MEVQTTELELFLLILSIGIPDPSFFEYTHSNEMPPESSEFSLHLVMWLLISRNWEVGEHVLRDLTLGQVSVQDCLLLVLLLCCSVLAGHACTTACLQSYRYPLVVLAGRVWQTDKCCASDQQVQLVKTAIVIDILEQT